MSSGAQGVYIAPGTGREIRFGPNRLTIKVEASSGSQQLGVFESVLPPGAEVFAHRHRDYEEAFYVLEGTIEYQLGEERVQVPTGGCVFAPAGVAHSFKNVGTMNAHHLVMTAPPQAVQLVEELGQAGPGGVVEVLARHHSELVTA